MKKHRIKHVTYTNGCEEYFVQKRFLFWWRDIEIKSYRYPYLSPTQCVPVYNEEDARNIIRWLMMDKTNVCRYDENCVMFCVRLDNDTYEGSICYAKAVDMYLKQQRKIIENSSKRKKIEYIDF